MNFLFGVLDEFMWGAMKMVAGQTYCLCQDRLSCCVIIVLNTSTLNSRVIISFLWGCAERVQSDAAVYMHRHE